MSIGPITRGMLRAGFGKWRIAHRMFSDIRVRNWFYFRARAATGAKYRRLAPAGADIVVIGDALTA